MENCKELSLENIENGGWMIVLVKLDDQSQTWRYEQEEYNLALNKLTELRSQYNEIGPKQTRQWINKAERQARWLARGLNNKAPRGSH